LGDLPIAFNNWVSKGAWCWLATVLTEALHRVQFLKNCCISNQLAVSSAFFAPLNASFYDLRVKPILANMPAGRVRRVNPSAMQFF